MYWLTDFNSWIFNERHSAPSLSDFLQPSPIIGDCSVNCHHRYSHVFWTFLNRKTELKRGLIKHRKLSIIPFILLINRLNDLKNNSRYIDRKFSTFDRWTDIDIEGSSMTKTYFSKKKTLNFQNNWLNFEVSAVLSKQQVLFKVKCSIGVVHWQGISVLLITRDISPEEFRCTCHTHAWRSSISLCLISYSHEFNPMYSFAWQKYVYVFGGVCQGNIGFSVALT